MKMMCDCGCGIEDNFNRLREVEIEVAIDESLRQTQIAKRFLVRRMCYEPFVEELTAKKLLNDITRRYMFAPWYKRIWKVRRIVRLQFLINSRNRGHERTKRIALRSGLMFCVPMRASGWLDRYYFWADTHRLVYRWHLITPRLWLIRKVDSWGKPQITLKK